MAVSTDMKRRARERQKAEGINYTTALRQVQAEAEEHKRLEEEQEQ